MFNRYLIKNQINLFMYFSVLNIFILFFKEQMSNYIHRNHVKYPFFSVSQINFSVLFYYLFP